MNDYKDLIERLNCQGSLGIGTLLVDASNAIKALIAERDSARSAVLNDITIFRQLQQSLEELAALKQKIASAEPVAVLNTIHGSLFMFHPFAYESEAYAIGELRMLYTLEGIKE